MTSLFPHLRGEFREVAEQYYETLKRLNSNDKVIISSLSEIANENKPNARIIVEVIEKRIKMVNPDCLLAHLYLLDSICKNHGHPFTDLFQANLVPNFIYVFSKANEKVRSSMYKLRHTWTGAPLFTSKLKELDTKVNAIDPAWPISHVPAAAPASSANRGNKILINPAKFAQGNSRTLQQREEEETERMRKELLRKEKELLELKKKDIDMQLMGLKKQHELKATAISSAEAGVAVPSAQTKLTPTTKKVRTLALNTKFTPPVLSILSNKTTTSVVISLISLIKCYINHVTYCLSCRFQGRSCKINKGGLCCLLKQLLRVLIITLILIYRRVATLKLLLEQTLYATMKVKQINFHLSIHF